MVLFCWPIWYSVSEWTITIMPAVVVKLDKAVDLHFNGHTKPALLLLLIKYPVCSGCICNFRAGSNKLLHLLLCSRLLWSELWNWCWWVCTQTLQEWSNLHSESYIRAVTEYPVSNYRISKGIANTYVKFACADANEGTVAKGLLWYRYLFF